MHYRDGVHENIEPRSKDHHQEQIITGIVVPFTGVAGANRFEEQQETTKRREYQAIDQEPGENCGEYRLACVPQSNNPIINQRRRASVVPLLFNRSEFVSNDPTLGIVLRA